MEVESIVTTVTDNSACRVTVHSHVRICIIERKYFILI